MTTFRNTPADAVESVVDAADHSGQGYEVLGQTKRDSYDGDFVLEGQPVTSRFGNVSDLWIDQCITYEQGLERIEADEANLLDYKGPLAQWQPVVTDEGQFALRHIGTGRDYTPTEHCLTQMMSVIPKAKGSSWAVNALMEEKFITEKRGSDVVLFARDERDARVLRDYVDLICFQADRVDQNKLRLFRTWDHDSTLRAILSKDYTVVNNRWVFDTVTKLIPGGLLSHWRGDADELWGNVLIPDTIRSESDSDYGGMVSIGNSEIGTRRITCVPSVFRAICMNGCIWDQELGKGIAQVHRKKDGKVDYDSLAHSIKVNIEAQIPLIDEGIRKVLAVKQKGFDGAEPAKVLAATVKKLRVSKKHVKKLVQCYGVEADVVGHSAFTVMQAFTRMGQTLNRVQQFHYDGVGGEIARMSDAKWKALIADAKTFDDKELEKLGVS